MTTNPDMTERLGGYLSDRLDQRISDADEKWASLSKREQALVKEAAVMAYVRGFQAAPYRKGIPADNAIVTDVLMAVDSFSDLYPVLAALPKKKRLR